jgi:hypothetical protein
MVRRGIKIEVGITNLDILGQVEKDKTRKYDLIASYEFNVKFIPYMMTWEVFKRIYHNKHRNMHYF